METSELVSTVNAWANGMMRPTTPTNLLANSVVGEVFDEGAKLLTVQFLYGDRTGTVKERPFDGRVNNVVKNMSQESLWLYGVEGKIPSGFSESKQDTFVIGTGEVHKCGNCRGQGKVRCSTCKGKVRWTERSGNDVVEKVCSCGDGKETCSTCGGYGDLESYIQVETNYKLTTSKSQEYLGEVPKELLSKSTGRVLFDEALEYPAAMLTKMLTGGIDAGEFSKLQDGIKAIVHDSISEKLAKYDGNIDMIRQLVDSFFKEMPNAAQTNKVLVHEIMPIRLKVTVEDAPVTRVSYMYKQQDYKLWVYGNENIVYAASKPFAFTGRLAVWIAGVLALCGGIVYSYMGM